MVWQVERDGYCRHVLARHWPDAVRHDDVRTVGAHNLAPVDILCGGFPCQDLSAAGKGAGFGTEDAPTRSGLWFEFRRIIHELRPAWVVGENVGHTWRRWVPVVRRSLWELGYASVPIRVRACDVGARHERARVFVVAHADGGLLREQRWRIESEWSEAAEPATDAADAGCLGWIAAAQRAWGGFDRKGWREEDRGCAAPDHARLRLAEREHLGGDGHEQQSAAAEGADDDEGWVSPGWGLAPRPWMVRGVHGLPGGVDGAWARAGWTGARLRTARIHALGNSVVPACAEVVGRLIAEAIRARGAA